MSDFKAQSTYNLLSLAVLQLNNENGTYFEESAGEDDVEDRFATAGTPAAEASAADATERSDSEVPGSDSEGVVSPTPVARSLNSSISVSVWCNRTSFPHECASLKISGYQICSMERWSS